MPSPRPAPASTRTGRRSAISEGQMQEALQKMLEAAAPLNNPSGIAEPLIELIARDLTRFEAPAHLGFQVGAGGAHAPRGAFPGRVFKYRADGGRPCPLA